MLQYQNLTPTEFGSSDYTTIADLNDGGRNRIWGFLLHTNTDAYYLKVTADSVDVIDMDIEELADDYKLRSMSGKMVPWWIYEYDQNRLSVRFPEPIDAATSISIQVKSKSGDKELYRGLLLKGTY